MPSIGTNSKPAYVYDAGTDTWIPIGPGEHTHDYAASAHNHDSTYINQSTFDAKGDLIVGTTDNEYSKLSSSGVNNQVLTIDTATATGLKWAAAESVPTVNWVRLTSGTSWSVPSGIKTATIWCIGGGGGGGGGNNNNNCGGGGGAGGLQTGTFDLSSVAGSTITYAIGAGGAGGAVATSGTVGGDTTFGTVGQAWYLLAKGGGNGRASGGAAISTTAGCGGGGDGTGGSSNGGGGGGGLGSFGRDASIATSSSRVAGTQGGEGGIGGGAGTFCGSGGSGIVINNYFVGGGGMGGNVSGNDYRSSFNPYGSKITNLSGTPTAADDNTGAGGVGGSTASGTGRPGGAGGSGVIFIQYLS